MFKLNGYKVLCVSYYWRSKKKEKKRNNTEGWGKCRIDFYGVTDDGYREKDDENDAAE